MILAAKLALGAVSTVALTGVWVARDGMVRVSVDQDCPGRTPQHIHLLVPASMIPAALHFVPRNHLREPLRHAREWMPAARVLCEELAKLPDTELVEVRNDRERVHVSVRDGKLYVDVDQPDQQVHVSFPLRTAWKIAQEIQDLGPES